MDFRKDVILRGKNHSIFWESLYVLGTYSFPQNLRSLRSFLSSPGSQSPSPSCWGCRWKKLRAHLTCPMVGHGSLSKFSEFIFCSEKRGSFGWFWYTQSSQVLSSSAAFGYIVWTKFSVYLIFLLLTWTWQEAQSTLESYLNLPAWIWFRYWCW